MLISNVRTRTVMSSFVFLRLGLKVLDTHHHILHCRFFHFLSLVLSFDAKALALFDLIKRELGAFQKHLLRH